MQVAFSSSWSLQVWGRSRQTCYPVENLQRNELGRVCLCSVGAGLPGFHILLGSVAREVSSPLPGVRLPNFLLTQEPPEGPTPPGAPCSPSPPRPVHTGTPTQTTQSPHEFLGAAGVPALRTQSWVQTGFLLVRRAVTLDRPWASQGLPRLPSSTVGSSGLHF